jgi:hypothetical protein
MLDFGEDAPIDSGSHSCTDNDLYLGILAFEDGINLDCCSPSRQKRYCMKSSLSLGEWYLIEFHWGCEVTCQNCTVLDTRKQWSFQKFEGD